MDYSIDDDKWNEMKENIADWFKANPEYDDRRKVVDALVSIGDVDPENRKRHRQAIASMFYDISNAPWPRRPPVWGYVVDREVNDLLAELRVAYMRLWEDNRAVRACIQPHSKSGSFFEDSKHFTDMIVAKARRTLLRAYKQRDGYSWDGSFDDDGMPIITWERE